MAVYVDPLREHPPVYGERFWCHMIADSEEELHRFAEGIGMPRRSYQGDHYDLRPEYRARALAAGALEMPVREMARRVCGERKRKRENKA